MSSALERLLAVIADGAPGLAPELNGSGVYVTCAICKAPRGFHVEPNGEHSARVQHAECQCVPDAGGPREDDPRNIISGVIANLLSRPTIVLEGNTPTGDLVDQAVEHLAISNVPARLFVRGGRLVRIVEDENGTKRIDGLDNDATTGVLIDRLAFVRLTVSKGADGNQESKAKFVEPPGYMPRAVRTRGTWPGLPALEAIVGIPVLRADGTVHDTPGYDPGSRMVYAPAPGFHPPSVPAKPTRRDVDQAVATLDDVLAEFPFATPADRANALALILTPFIRSLVDLAPLTLISARSPGTGKGLLLGVAATIATGSPPAALQLTGEEELRKAITAELFGGATFVVFDDVKTLQGNALTTALTATTWGDRKLGETTKLSIPQRATWVALGNNVTIGGDLVRRVVRVSLDASVARPWERTGFRHPNLIAHARQHRGELVGAALTLCRAWYAAGKPAADLPALGTFEQWTQTVGGILAHAGIPGFLGNLQETWNEAATTEQAWEAFLDHVLAHTNGETFTVGELHDDLDWHSIQDALPDEIASKMGDRGFTRSLGRALRARERTMHGAHGVHVLATGQNRNKVTTYRVATSQEPS